MNRRRSPSESRDPIPLEFTEHANHHHQTLTTIHVPLLALCNHFERELKLTFAI